MKANAKKISNLDLHVEGLCCAECSMAVGKALARQEGVQQVKILSGVEKVQVTYDESRIGPKELVGALAALGHEVRPVEEKGPSVSPEEKRFTVHTFRFAFVAFVAIIALLEIGGEYLGLLDAAKERIPLPLLLGTILLGGYPIFKRAFLGLLGRQINVDTMMSVGILGAAAIGQYTSSMLIVFFMNIAHFLEESTTGKSRQAIQELIQLAPKTARIKVDGEEVEVGVDELKGGDIVMIRPGEQIPADGVVVHGRSSVNQASITGESLPQEKQPGDEVFAATLNELGYLEVQVTRVGPDTTFGKIIKLVEEAEAVKAPIQKFADRFTTYFLPTAVGVALLTYLVSGQILYAIAVLVAACPCAVGLATPLSVIASVGSSARRGLLVKGGLHLENLARVDCILMDKTGTLTFGKPQVTDVVALDTLPASDILRFAASVEKHSKHPIASSILSHAQSENIPVPDPEGFEYFVGKGISGTVQGRDVRLGTARFLEEMGINGSSQVMNRAAGLEKEGKTAFFLSVDGELKGIIGVADTIRDEVPEAIEALKRQGIRRLILLTGDNGRVAAAVAGRLGLKEFRSGLLPEDKIAVVRQLQREGYIVAMVGDGVNDAPALTQADVGIAMGVAGSDAALEAAHIALMRDDWNELPLAIEVGRRTYRTIRQNIALGITWDIITMGLASIGILTPVMAAATEAMPDVLVSFNSARLLKSPRKFGE